MKIGVPWIFLLCTSSAAIAKSTTETQSIPSKSWSAESKDLMKRTVQRHQIHEYSKSMDAVDPDLKINNTQGQDTLSAYYSETVDAEDVSGKKYDKESARFLRGRDTIRINSNQPRQISNVKILSRGEKVLSRKRKYKMEQAVLALLMAYKMKFTALIPVLVGGLSLLMSTASLAGFFFALFAAVLGLKIH